MTAQQHRESIRKLRSAIRNHRDQKGDDRCWVDDYSVWALLKDSPGEPRTPPPFAEAMRCCRSYWTYRKSDTPEPQQTEAPYDPAQWDDDLREMNEAALIKELKTIESAIRAHRDIHERERTIDDDRKLYSVLPEKISADFRLPSEENFLGEGRAPRAGCPSFWRSHENCTCTKHNLHAWGPCKE